MKLPFSMLRSASLLLLAGCGFTTGSECVEVESISLADDEDSPLGFSADDVLGTIGAARTVVGHLGGDGMEGDAVDVTIGVTRGEGAAVFTRTELATTHTPNGRLFGETEYDMLVICHDSLAVPVDLAVTTADGTIRFEEPTDAVPAGDTLDFVHVSATVPIDEAEGLPENDNPNVEEVFASAGFYEGGAVTSGQVGWSGRSDTSSFAVSAVTWDSRAE